MIESTRAFAKLVDAFNQNDWSRVQQRSAQLLLIEPGHAGVRYMAGVACMQTAQMSVALEHLRAAAAAQPPTADFVAQYAKVLAITRQLREARAQADRAMALVPTEAFTYDTLGSVYLQANALAPSADAFRRAAALAPGQPGAHFRLAHALVTLGDDSSAEAELEACLRLDPTWWRAYLTLAQLRRQTSARNHLDRLRGLLVQHGDVPAAQLYLQMALGKECDDLAEYAHAFDHYTRGKAAGRQLRPYDFARDAAMFEALLRAFPDADSTRADGDPTHEPIFIIGMPRTGTTLLDRVLSSHPDVRSVGELQNFPTTLQRASRCPRALLEEPDLAARTAHIDWRQLGAAYLASTRPASGETPRFIDKLPHNFLYAGFIARALPNAKIVCLRRHPLDTCLGNFRHLFEQETGFYDYAFNLDDTGRYYVQFDRLLAHWRAVMPGRILELPYESLVTDREASVRTLLDFCDLPWNDACLHPEANTAPVSTPNAWQVRAPIFHRAIGHWRHYVKPLQGLLQQLQAAGIDVPD